MGLEKAVKTGAAVADIQGDPATGTALRRRTSMRAAATPIDEGDVRRLAELHPEVPLVHFMLGSAYERRRQLERAAQEYEIAISGESNSTSAVPLRCSRSPCS